MGLQPPDQCSCPQSRPQPLPKQIWIFLPGGRERGLGASYTVLLVRLCCPALFVCAIIFVKIVLTVVATPLPPASGPTCLPGLPAPHSPAPGFPRLMPALAARSSQQRPMTQQPAQSTSFWGSRVECCSAESLSPEPWERGPYMSPPCPPSTRLNTQSSQFGPPLFTCQMAPAPCAPSPLWNQSFFPQALQCPFVHPLCPSVQ